MKISTRLAAVGAICAAATLLIGGAFVVTSHRVNEALQTNRTAAELVEGAAGLRFLTLEYALQPGERVRTQWRNRHRSLGTLLSEARFNSATELGSLARVQDAHQDIAAIFAQLTDAQAARAAATERRDILDELVRRLTASATNKIQIMITDALRLQDESRDAVLAAQRDTFVTVIALSALLALLVSVTMVALFRSIATPLTRLGQWAELVGAGNLHEPTGGFPRDEIGDLARHFDRMAVQLRLTTVSRDDLIVEMKTREHAEHRLQAQLARLDLLSQITRAIGERQDLKSIFQVAVRSIEDHLPADFSCICLYEHPTHTLLVNGVGVRSEALALELAMSENARIPIDENGLSRCISGQVVYEADVSQVDFPFPRRLAAAGLRSLVAAPLLVESRVFGAIITARWKANSFSSGECEFLRQLSEHVALAAHQAQLYDALQEAYNDLRQSQEVILQQERLRALGQMASGIAHDINNAISPVALYTESILEKEPNLSERSRGYLETILRSIDDVGQTVARMREFYRQRETQLTLAPVDLNEMAEQVIQLTRARWSDMAQQRGVMIQLSTALERNLPRIMGVESEIREALTNLIFNAVDAMPQGGTLMLRTHSSESAPGAVGAGRAHTVTVEVADSGIGMDAATRQRCLEPFFTTKGERGTGLGLAMVYGAVQRHGGELDIESTLGRGTAIMLRFPAAPAETSGPQQSDTIAHPLSDRLRILTVDDDPLLLKSLRETLEADGHIVTAASGGQEGINLFLAAHAKGQAFSLVITDLGMPYVDGRKVAGMVKSASPNTPVILLTGWGQRMAADGEIPLFVDHVLGKPPRLRELREALARCCNGAST